MKLSTVTAAVALTTAVPAFAADVTAPVALPAPPPGKGQIVFFRSGTIMGVALGCSVHENGKKVSSLGAGKYFIMVTEPGRHEFSVQSEAKDVLALEVEPDETQFAACKIKMGIVAGRPDIRPATEAEFRAKSYKMVDADDMGPGPGALRPDAVAAALAAPKPASMSEAPPVSPATPPAAETPAPAPTAQSEAPAAIAQ
jgi:hypothetical protein